MGSIDLSKFYVNPKLVIGIMIGLTIYLIYTYLVQANIIGVRKGTAKTKEDIKKDKDSLFYRNLFLAGLSFCEKTCESFGFKPNETKLERYKFFINRLGITLPYIDRNLRPKEVMGFFKLVKFACCFLALFLTALTANRIFIALIFGFFINVVFESAMEMKIMEEDKEIEESFPDLYLLLYSRLVRGTNSRLAPVLDDYIKSLDAIDGEESHPAIRKLVLTLRKNIELYGDDSLAIQNMREIYKSAMVVNFFNLAVQSLRGVDNRDKLLAFKMELSQKKLNMMTEKAEKMVLKGQRAILLIYIILAEFVVLSWVAKAGISLRLI